MTFVYKACRNSIVTLQLFPDSVTNENREGVVDPLHAKFRTNKAQVVSMVDPFTKQLITEDTSLHDPKFSYKVGEIVQTPFDNDINKVCASGIHYFKTEETAVRWHIRPQDIKLHGSWRNWYDNGRLGSEGTNKNGEPNGHWKSWYESGQLKSEGTYKNGELDGTWRTWYENGQLGSEEPYKNGELDGTSRGWYENGQLKYETTYKNGQKDGTWNAWYESGQPKFEGTHKNGNLDVKWVR